ncbi:MAG: guanylate kinase [Ruminococcaceae bacterium]|nr:guanylate kinase [Oscillospiraceae bacterium]
MSKGLMLIISGPAGSGKGTVNAHLIGSGDFVYSVSATTRMPRPGEVDGVNYHFITKEDFISRIENGDMLEYTEYCGNFYGTPKKEAIAVLESGKNLILEIEVDGANQIKEKYPDAVLIMLLPPSFKTQEQRLRGRGTESEDKVLARLERTREELADVSSYDYIVYNYDGKDTEAADRIRAIVDAEKSSIRRNPNVRDRYFED